MVDLKKLKAMRVLEVDFGTLNEAYQGLNAELLKPYGLPYEKYMELWQADDTAELTDYARAVKRLTHHIIKWNLPNIENGDVLPLPKDDSGVLPAMQTDWVNLMGGALIRDYNVSIQAMGKALGDGEENLEATSESPQSFDLDSPDSE